MLRLMREQATSWLIKVLLGAIVIVFIFWGVGSFRSQRGGRIALVNGEQITLDDYREAYNNLIEQYRQRFGNNLNDEMIKTLQLKQQALNQLINNRLLVQEARRLNFRISDKMLAETIMNIGAFQSAGVFDRRLYQNLLSRLRMTPEEFEIAQREAMLVEKLRTLILDSVKVSDQEAREWFNWSNTLVNIDFVLFDPEQYTDVNPTSEEINAYFENHKANYKTDAMVKVRFLQFRPDAYRSEITIADEEIQDYYNEHPEEFKIPKTVEARHILIKVDQDEAPKGVEETRKRALEILEKARSGQDFAELAKTYSEGPTRDKGGYLGAFRKEAMVKPFSDKAFSMKAGEISEPVRTRFGWHLIKVEKVNEASTRTLADSKPNIRKKLLDEKAKIRAYDEAETVSEVSFEGDDLLRIAQERNLPVQTTDFFARKGPEKDIRSPAKFAAAAFDLQVMEISDILNLEDQYYILQVIEKIPEKISEFETVKDAVRQDVIKEQKDAKAREDADAFLAALKNGKPMGSESKKFHLAPASTGFFKRNASIPTIGFEQAISDAAFKLSAEKNLPETIIKGKKGYYVIQFRERKVSESEDFNAEKAPIKQRLLQQKQSRMFEAFVTEIKNRSEISIKEEYIQ